MAERFSFTFHPLPPRTAGHWNETSEQHITYALSEYQTRLDALMSALKQPSVPVDTVHFPYSNGRGGLMVNLPGVTAQMIEDARGAKRLGSFIRHETKTEELSEQATETIPKHSNGYALSLNGDHLHMQETADV